MQRKEILGNADVANLKGYRQRDVSRKDKRDYLAALLAFTYYNDTMRKALAPIIYALIVETGKSAMGEVTDPSQFNPTDLAVLNYYQQRASKIATDVNAETEKQLRASLGQGIDGGENQDQLRARIEAVMGAALTYRADRISRTEVTRAQGFADVTAWRQSGMVSGKAWYTIEDERTCVFCESMDGVIVSLDSNFLSLGDTLQAGDQNLPIVYDAVGSPPVHVNCRCGLEPILVNIATGDEA